MRRVLVFHPWIIPFSILQTTFYFPDNGTRRWRGFWTVQGHLRSRALAAGRSGAGWPRQQRRSAGGETSRSAGSPGRLASPGPAHSPFPGMASTLESRGARGGEHALFPGHLVSGSVSVEHAGHFGHDRRVCRRDHSQYLDHDLPFRGLVWNFLKNEPIKELGSVEFELEETRLYWLFPCSGNRDILFFFTLIPSFKFRFYRLSEIVK